MCEARVPIDSRTRLKSKFLVCPHTQPTETGTLADLTTTMSGWRDRKAKPQRLILIRRGENREQNEKEGD